MISAEGHFFTFRIGIRYSSKSFEAADGFFLGKAFIYVIIMLLGGIMNMSMGLLFGSVLNSIELNILQ